MYLIQLPGSSDEEDFWSWIFPLNYFSVLAKKRENKKTKSKWFDLEDNLVSDKYKKRAIQKIPVRKIKESLVLKAHYRFSRNVAVFEYNNKKFVLEGSDEEYKRLKKYLQDRSKITCE